MRKHIAMYGMLIALALVVSYIERLLPLDMGIPGVKLGLANIVTMVALYMLSGKVALIVLVVRVLLGGILFANGFSILYSLAGGLLSLVVMWLVKKQQVFSVVGVSVVGGIAHNLGQLLVAVFVLENGNLLYYFPALLVSGTICGAIIGILGGLLMKKLPKNLLSMLLLYCICSVTFNGCMDLATKEYKNSGFAMGTSVTRTLYGENSQEADQAIMKCINEIDGQLSWRNEKSEIALINENAGSGESVTVSEGLTNWLQQIQQFAQENPDTVTPLMGKVIEQWNFSSEKPMIPKKGQLEPLLPYINDQDLQILGNEICLKNSQNKLDLGAYGKGIACDGIYQVLEEYSLQGAMISMGNSSILTYKEKQDKIPWKIGIQHPRKQPGTLIGVLSVEGTAFISTSGDYERCMIVDEKRYHHILDPTTGYPAQTDLSSVTIVGDSGVLCDALSTACFILGKEKGIQLLDRYDVGGIFIETDGTITEILKGNCNFHQE